MKSNFFKKAISVLMICVLSVAGLAGCSKGPNNGTNSRNKGTENKSTNTETDSNEKEMRKVSIQIDGAAVPYYAPLYIAQEKGFFAEEGLEVEFYYAAAAEIVKNVAANNVEFGFPNGDSVITAKSQEIPVKIVHSTYQNGLGATIFKTELGIKEPKDLKGKKVAITSLGSPNYIQLQVMLDQAELTLDDIQLEVIGTGAIVNALVTDQVDAIVFSTLRTIELLNQGVEVQEIKSDDYLPSHGNVLIVSDKLADTDPEVVQAFINGLNKGLQYIIDGNVQESINIAIEKYAEASKGKEEITAKIFNEVFIPYLWQSENTKKHGLGYSDVEKWNESIKILKEYQIIEKEFDAADMIYSPSK